MKIDTNKEKIEEILNRGTEEVIEKEHLKEALLSGKQLRVKFGVDPTAPDLHLGHSVPLRKLKQFQDLGHQVVLLIGDFTAKIGDPTGKNEARKPLTDADVKKNMENYLEHAGKIIDIKKTEIVYNNNWFSKGGVELMLEIAASGSIQQVLRRADFQKRLDDGRDITLLETLYPLFQGYDSVEVKADVEVGGTDQLFNLLMGRKMQRHFNLPEQDVLTTPLLEGLDGEKKMSKSVGNYVSLSEDPNSMFGKIMSLPDSLIEKYFILCTNLDKIDMDNILQGVKIDPMGSKFELAVEIVSMYYSPKEAMQAKEEWVRVFSKKEKPTDIEEFKTSGITSTANVLVSSGFASSNSEAVRLVDQGGVRLNDEIVKDAREEVSFKDGDIIQVGKRRFLKIKL